MALALAALATAGACRRDLIVGRGAEASLRVEPAMAMVSIENGAPATAHFKAFVGDTEVTEDAATTWTSDNAPLASVDATGTTTTGTRYGGETTIRVSRQGATASARLRVRFVLQTSVPSGAGAAALPASPAQALAGPADATRAPELVYPNDGVLLPPNLFEIEVHFRPGAAANTLFEVGFANALTDVRAITRCAPVGDAIDPGCLYAPTRDVWTGLAETNRGAEPLTLTVRATDDAGAGVGTSHAQTLRFAPADVRGALYYWTTSQGSAIMRWNFGDATRTMAERFAGPEASGDPSVFCVGCHALSHDGGKMALGTSLTSAATGNSVDGSLLLYDVAKRAPIVPFPLAQRATFESWGPDDGAFVERVRRQRQREGPHPLRPGRRARAPARSRSAARRPTTPTGPPTARASRSPRSASRTSTRRPSAAASATSRPAPAASGRRSSGSCRASPARTATTRPSRPTAASSSTTSRPAPQARPTTRSATATPIRAHASSRRRSAGRRPCPSSSPPRTRPASPIAARPTSARRTRSGTRSRFTSRRRARSSGSRSRRCAAMACAPSPPPASSHEGLPVGTLIWMAALDPAKLAQGQDPSSAAFCLPFQDITTSNHIAQWTGVAVQ